MRTEVYPLERMINCLKVGPPSLSFIFDLLENSEYLSEFLDLVREYLPEYETEIMELTTWDKIGMFFNRFKDKYFPLDDWHMQNYYENGDDEDGISPLAEFVSYMPAPPWGMTEDDYHNFMQYSPGVILLLSLVSSPYSSSGKERIPILEQVKQLVGKECASLIPANGLQPDTLHCIFDNTDYSAVSDFADKVHRQTGTYWLDATQEDWGMDPPEWDKAYVENLTSDYEIAKEINDRIEQLTTWLEEDKTVNFKLLLRMILGEKKVPQTLYELYRPKIEINEIEVN